MKRLALLVAVLFMVGCAGVTPVAQTALDIAGQTVCYYVAQNNPSLAPQLSTDAQAIVTMANGGSTVAVLDGAISMLINTYGKGIVDPIILGDAQLLIDAFVNPTAANPVITVTSTVISQVAASCVSGVTMAGTVSKAKVKRGIVKKPLRG